MFANRIGGAGWVAQLLESGEHKLYGDASWVGRFTSKAQQDLAGFAQVEAAPSKSAQLTMILLFKLTISLRFQGWFMVLFCHGGYCTAYVYYIGSSLSFWDRVGYLTAVLLMFKMLGVCRLCFWELGT